MRRSEQATPARADGYSASLTKRVFIAITGGSGPAMAGEDDAGAGKWTLEPKATSSGTDDAAGESSTDLSFDRSGMSSAQNFSQAGKVSPPRDS